MSGDDIHPRGAARRAPPQAETSAEEAQAIMGAHRQDDDAIAVAYAALFKPNPANPVDPVVIVLDDLRRAGFARRSTFVQGAPDLTAVNEGRRQLLMRIEAMVDRGNVVMRGRP